MRICRLFPVLLVLSCGQGSPGPQDDVMLDDALYAGSTFEELDQVIHDGPYRELHQDEVTYRRFFESSRNVFRASVGELFSNRHDFHPHYSRLLHANGACMTGTWHITESSSYGGMFRQDSMGLVVARASTAFTNTRRGAFRAFALAVKILPTMDPRQRVYPANLFTFDAVMGADRERFQDVTLSNEPPAGGPLEGADLWRTAWEVLRINLEVDSMARRPLHPIAQLTGPDPETVEHPIHLDLVPEAMADDVHDEDFRDELMTATRGRAIRYGIHVRGHLRANQSGIGRRATGPSTRLGELLLERAVASEGCDHRIRFRHVKNR